jgi:hypothetical protein
MTQAKKAAEALLCICDGSNWPEDAQSGVGFRLYTEITDQLHEIADDLLAALPALECGGPAQFLWKLLDDIDTAGDIAKADDKAYREMVERIQRRRFEVGSTDGYTVTFVADK